MSQGDPPEPLWATSLADRPGTDDQDSHPATVDQRARRRRPGGRRIYVIALGALLATVATVLAIVLSGDDLVTVHEVPSYWNDVPMTCHTERLEKDGRAIEWFRCRAVGAGRLPPGVYRSPDAWWRSDITRRRALANEMRISRDGELTGWAMY